MATPVPLRTAIIGLSASAVTSWASTGHLPGLLSPLGRKYFTITALCNSSVDAANAAIKTYNLPSSTKAYGSPHDLAQDPDIDLVIVTTRVDKHYETSLPSLKAGQRVYIEWPVASNLSDIEELVSVAKEKNVDAIIGLQGRLAPPVVKMKEILQEGKVGKVLSSSVRAFGGTIDRNYLPPGLKYFSEKEVGGNPMTIGFAHMIDFVQSVLGDLEPKTTHVHTQLQRPEIRIRNPETGAIEGTTTSNVPDLLSLHGTLSPSETVSKNATLTTLFRRGQPYKDEAALTWHINCTEAELRLTAPSGTTLHADGYTLPVRIEIHWFATDEIEKVHWDWSEEQKGIPDRGRSVFAHLIAYAQGQREKVVGIESALRRARQVDGWVWGSEE